MKKFIGLLIVSLAFSTGFAAQSKEQTSNNQAKIQTNQKDAEIIAFLIVLNKNELAAAKEARKKNVNSSVKSYADLMNKEHQQNLKDTLKISKKIDLQPANTARVISLKQNGKKELIILTPLKSTAFEKTYIDAMVKGHTDALVIIDTDFLKNVSNPVLKKHLQATRDHVAHHLEKAKEIQKAQGN